MKRLSLISISLLCVITSVLCSAQDTRKNSELSLQQLLQQVGEGRLNDRAENQKRLADFRANLGERNAALTSIQAERHQEESTSQQLESQFEVNEQSIASLEQRLDERLGSLKELFGVLQQVASDSQAQFSNSLTEIHYPDRSQQLLDFAQKMGQTTDLPSIDEIEQLWFELQREMTASGEVVKTELSVLNSAGEELTTNVIRVGNFNLVANNKYFQLIPETGRIVEYGRQPADRYMSGAQQIGTASETVLFTIDPLRGQLLSLLVMAPQLNERIAQGGVIGYIIIATGILGVLLALFKFVSLSLVNRQIEQQKRDLDQPGNNPLGRVKQIYQAVQNLDSETIELKLSEAVLREVPRVNRGISLLKIIAAVAPLMGLLGTVTGMIITFQAITLFGAGDPKLMAGGISQALVTTVLGLCVAIPVLLLHTLVQSRAQQITDSLEQESIALIASKSSLTTS